MTACTASFSISIPPSSDGRTPPVPTTVTPPPEAGGALRRGLVERLAARISAGSDEVLPFADERAATAALARRFARGRRIGLALGERNTLIDSLRAESGERRELAWAARPSLDDLVALARQVDTLFIEAPIVRDGVAVEPITPRELLALRARAPRPLLVLDLRGEDLARTPLTQPALLIPGTVIVRGFGALWAREGAAELARTAFVAGPADLVAGLAGDLGSASVPDDAQAATLIAELDAPDLERRVQCAARALRCRNA
ncbi:MAG: hypothetical protein LW806_03510 [Planctomycetaceae bacterium]|nr:hypothetical protein [Planctomycetaceae bacterium]